jgi:hypothetical protein
MKENVNHHFKTKPQHLLPLPTAKKWEAPIVYQRIYKIDYDISTRHLESYFLTNADDRSIKPVIIIAIYGGWGNQTYRWYRPNVDAIIEEGNFELMRNLLIEDVIRHI